jgi:hypothetical protein
MQVLTQISYSMERLSVLIHKLKEQFEQNVPPTQMLGTVRQIEAELSQMATRPTPGLGSAKVAVMMPSGLRPEVQKEPVAAAEPVMQRQTVKEQPVREQATYQPKPAVETFEPVAAPAETNGYNGYHATKKQEQYQPQPAAQAWSYDPLQEIPTLSHQQGIREINDVIGINGDSLNDRLREERIELAHVLTEAPIRDLKKAIGVNDRYVFLNELFRGDEAMYERSIKTLNGFRVYQEAEYWINRELKIKLGWNDSNNIVRHFYQLVRRRFS